MALVGRGDRGRLWTACPECGHGRPPGRQLHGRDDGGTIDDDQWDDERDDRSRSVCGGFFVTDPCPADKTRLAVEFMTDAHSVTIWSDTADDLGPLRVRTVAQRWDPIERGECWFEGPTNIVHWTALRPAI